MSRIIELKWKCGECSTDGILGRHKRCTSCGSPREKGEMNMRGLTTDRDGDGYNDAKTVTESELVSLATAGADWFCTHCDAGNRGDTERCEGLRGNGCGAPRYGKAEEDHPDEALAGGHRDVVIGDDPWEDGYSPEEFSGGEAWMAADTAPAPDTRQAVPKPKRHVEPEVDYAQQRRQAAERQKMMLIGGGIVAVFMLFGLIFWMFTTHEVEGTVSQMTWSQSTIRQHWTQTTTRKWKDETRQRQEVKPTNGSGERAGMVLDGACKEEHHHDQTYQCGTKQESYECGSNESYSATCSKSESYACGETCRDNGNGFATCSTKYCSRSVDYSCTKSRYVSKTCQRTVPKYCERPIYETKCRYRTQVWNVAETAPATGTGHDTRWPEVEVGPEDRLRYAADYSVTIAYHDRGEDETHTLKPGDTKWLGMSKTLTHGQSRKAEKAYKAWEPRETVTLKVNNLGGIHSVTHGGLEIEIADAR
ncbi:hypothetical protein N9917_00500 [Deltaproteobacteria bacterium]|nr:hypothetical protein [Deltaproteobacteria bacterium]